MKNNLYKPWMSRKECEENVEFLLSKIKSNFISFIISIILILTTFIIYIVALNNLNVKLLTLVPYFYTFDILFLLIDLIRFIVLKEKALDYCETIASDIQFETFIEYGYSEKEAYLYTIQWESNSDRYFISLPIYKDLKDK